jgi:hypothetical protein
VTLGVVLAFGDTGFVPKFVGATGAVESSTYVVLVNEHPDVLLAASVAVAKKVVVVLSATETEMLKFPPVAVPVTAAAPVQPGFA